MNYKNLDFFIFMISVLALYFSAKTHRTRLFILMCGSLFYYLWAGFFDFLIFSFVITASYISVYLAEKFKAHQKIFITLGVFFLGVHLFIWKYYSSLFLVAKEIWPELKDNLNFDVPLPLGISFFTFQGIAYLIDYSKKLTPKLNLKEFILYKSFFPQLIAGPIVRPKDLAPQIQNLSQPSAGDLQQGLILFAIGFFKKIIIADRIYPFVINIMNSPHVYNRLTLLMGCISVFILIWADFGGYTDMGRGCAKMLGINLPKNFLSPIFSKNPSEFWLRWHVSLGLWIKEYIYKPIAQINNLIFNPVTALFAAFLFSGLWHGTKLTYIFSFLFGALLIFIEKILVYFKINQLFQQRISKLTYRSLTTGLTFLTICIFSGSLFQARSTPLALDFFKTLIIHPGPLQIDSGVFLWSFAYMLLLEIIFYYNLESKRQPCVESIIKWTSMLQTKSPNRYLIFNICFGFLIGISIILCLALRRDGGFSSFIYFEF